MASFTGMGTQDKKKVAIAGGLGVAVLALAIHTIFGGSPTSTPLPPPAEPTALAGPSASPARASAANGETSLDPRLYPGLMAENENYLYNGNGRDIFAEQAGPPAAVNIEKVKGPIRPSMQMAANAGPAGPPPVDLKFFGYEAPKNGGPRRAFLLNGDNVFVAGVGDVVSHRYRVVQIAPSSIQVEDLPYSDTQTLPLIRN